MSARAASSAMDFACSRNSKKTRSFDIETLLVEVSILSTFSRALGPWKWIFSASFPILDVGIPIGGGNQFEYAARLPAFSKLRLRCVHVLGHDGSFIINLDNNAVDTGQSHSDGRSYGETFGRFNSLSPGRFHTSTISRFKPLRSRNQFRMRP